MNKNRLIGMVCVLLVVFLCPGVNAKEKHRESKTGILLVAFGTSVPQAEVSFNNIEKKVKESFPGIPVRWAYTSSIIRKKLAGQGKHLDSVEMALVRMMDDGFTDVAVQSLHTIRGEEFDDLVETVRAISHIPGGFRKLEIGTPLLSSEKDLELVSRAMVDNFPEKRKKNEAVLIMGHGTPHPANAFYTALMYHLQKKDPNVFVATVEGSPSIDDAVSFMKARKLKTAWLVPFMSVAGDHARNDMAGDEDDSWKSILGKEKITSVPVLKGTAEYDNMVAIWIGHLKDALDGLTSGYCPKNPACPR
jgi:sirohydrochlorin cobaltochelatase